MYQVLYRSFRPETFETVLGQEHIIKILENQINSDSTGHAYLFCGTRGTGKTTTARILAKGVNCTSEGKKPCGECSNCVSIKNGTFMDVVEIDAASNNGVENIRELRESVKYPPAVGRCKVYIVDEVHMLSTGAFNALLKTLEEPPENVMFILATTEVQKLPATILSRCLRLDFHRVPERQLKEGMKRICDTIGVEIEEAALGLVATNADGSVRDGLSLLDQCITAGSNKVTRDLVLSVLGTAGEEIFTEMSGHVQAGQTAEALLLLHRALEDGIDVKQFMKDWISHYRNLLMVKYIKSPEEMLSMSTENIERIKGQSEALSLAEINFAILELSRTLAEAKWSAQPRILLELAVVKLAEGDMAEEVARTRTPQRQTNRTPGTSLPNTAGAAASSQSGASPQSFSAAGGETAHAGTGEAAERSGDGSVKLSGSAAQAGSGYAGTDSSAAANAQAAGQTAVPSLDLSKLWQSVIREGEKTKGSFTMLRNSTTLRKVTDKIFIVEAASPSSKKYVESNQAFLEELMKAQTGMELRLESRTQGEGGEASQDGGVEELAASIGDRLGINIDIQ